MYHYLNIIHQRGSNFVSIFNALPTRWSRQFHPEFNTPIGCSRQSTARDAPQFRQRSTYKMVTAVPSTIQRSNCMFPLKFSKGAAPSGSGFLPYLQRSTYSPCTARRRLRLITQLFFAYIYYYIYRC